MSLALGVAERTPLQAKRCIFFVVVGGKSGKESLVSSGLTDLDLDILIGFIVKGESKSVFFDPKYVEHNRSFSYFNLLMLRCFGGLPRILA